MDPGHYLSGEKTEWPRLVLFQSRLDFKGLKFQLFLKNPFLMVLDSAKGPYKFLGQDPSSLTA